VSGAPLVLALALALAPARDSTATRLDPVPVKQAIAEDPLLGHTLRGLAPAGRGARLILVNLNARRLWYLDGDTIRFAGPVGVGRGTPQHPGRPLGRHGTPRTRFTVLRKDTMPEWIPPDWYFREVAATTGRPLRVLTRRDTLVARDGSAFYVAGGEVMWRDVTGDVGPVAIADGAGGRRELVVDGRIVVPPIGTTQRRYPRVLGPRRLVFRDGYAIHGTDEPETIGRAASHGCLRLRNDDVLALFDLVAVGTPVFVR
jgi:hypothetical protein